MTESAEFDALLDACEGVVDTTIVLRYLSRARLRWKLESGRWQHPAPGIIVAHSGPLTDQQALRVALLWGGPRAVLAGLTAAWLDGFRGYGDKAPFGERPVYLFVPPGRNARPGLEGTHVIVHQSRSLRPEDVHPVREPRRTRIARSLLDAAQWMASDRGTMAVLAAGVQQGLVLAPQLAAAAAQMSRLRRRALIVGALADIEGGAQALSELDFTRQVIRRHRLPEPERQAARKDKQGRRRWIDVCWDQWKLMVEIDGAQHRDALTHWEDMNRDNSFTIDGYRVLRFPAWLVRERPWEVAGQIRAALRQAGCRC